MIGLAGALGLALLLWVQRTADARAWPAWERIAAGPSRDAAWMRGAFVRRTALIGAFVDAVEDACREGDFQEAVDHLTRSRDHVRQHAQDTRESLREWAEEARALLALLPLAPLSPLRVRLGRLRALAVVWRTLHGVAVTSRERFLLRLMVLGWAFAALVRWWDAVRLPRSAACSWAAAHTLRSDLDTLGTTCADTYEALLASRRAAGIAQSETHAFDSTS